MIKLIDLIDIKDKMFLRLGGKLIEMAGVRRGDGIPVRDNFYLVARERGKIRFRRESHNIWTLTGKEFTIQSMVWQAPPEDYVGNLTSITRNDKLRYLGAGTGSMAEVVGVTALASPIDYESNLFLAPFNLPAEFPDAPSKAAVRLHFLYEEEHLSTTNHPAPLISEFGAFTDGDPAQNWEPLTRSRYLADAANQQPAAYKAIEPFPKTSMITVEVIWEFRV